MKLAHPGTAGLRLGGQSKATPGNGCGSRTIQKPVIRFRMPRIQQPPCQATKATKSSPHLRFAAGRWHRLVSPSRQIWPARQLIVEWQGNLSSPNGDAQPPQQNRLAERAALRAGLAARHRLIQSATASTTRLLPARAKITEYRRRRSLTVGRWACCSAYPIQKRGIRATSHQVRSGSLNYSEYPPQTTCRRPARPQPAPRMNSSTATGCSG